MPNTDTVPVTLVSTLAEEASYLFRRSVNAQRDADRALEREDDPAKFRELSELSLNQLVRAESLLSFMAYEFLLTPPVPYAPVSR